jgi:hypothetical protein
MKGLILKQLCIEVPVTNQKSKGACIDVLGVPMLPLSTILIFDFGIVPMVWYLFHSINEINSKNTLV